MAVILIEPFFKLVVIFKMTVGHNEKMKRAQAWFYWFVIICVSSAVT